MATLAIGVEPLSFPHSSRGRKAGDLSFDESQFNSTDASGLSSTEYVRHSCFLQIVDLHEAVTDFATKQCCKFRVGHQMESAGQIIAGPLF